MAKPMRVYRQIDCDTCMPIAYAQIPGTNKVKATPLKGKPKPIKIVDAQNMGCPVIPLSNQKSETMTKYPAPKANIAAIEVDETVYGNAALSRREQPGDESYDMEWWISLDNTTGAAIENVMFDSHTLINFKEGLGAWPAGLVVDGNFGAQTPLFFAKITGSNPVRLHTLHTENVKSVGGGPSTAFYTGGVLYKAKGKLDNSNTRKELVSYRRDIRADQFNTSIQYKSNFRQLIDGFAGLNFRIPAGEKVIFTWWIKSVEQSYAMVLK